MAQFVVEYGKAGTASAAADGRLDAPPFHRNHEPIWKALNGFLDGRGGDVLEIGSGTGQHIATYAKWAPRITWWPSDVFDSHLTSIEAWRKLAGLDNLRAPQRIDLTDPAWRWSPGGEMVAMQCFNVLHIAPWSISCNLIAGAGRYLREGGKLFIYGPFKRDGAHTAPSNAEFDASLRAANPDWGVRDVADLNALAQAAHLSPAEITPMPANNLVLAFARDTRQH